MVLVHDFDMRVLLATYGGAHGPWSHAMLAFTLLGSGWSALLLVPLFFAPQLGTRTFARALGIAIAAQAIGIWATKQAVGRVRPWIALGYPPPYGAPHDPSFPSGHASGSFCVAAFLVVVLPAVWHARPGRARLLAAAAVVIAFLIALSRVYLGAHFPSDVIAGALVGSAFGAAAGGLYVASRAEPRPAPFDGNRGRVERTPKRG
jgi:undecaprenyl-diphosphatase